MENLWSPWRSQYIESFDKPNSEHEECFLCSGAIAVNEDEPRLIVAKENSALLL